MLTSCFFWSTPWLAADLAVAWALPASEGLPAHAHSDPKQAPAPFKQEYLQTLPAWLSVFPYFSNSDLTPSYQAPGPATPQLPPRRRLRVAGMLGAAGTLGTAGTLRLRLPGRAV